jgi:NAD-dependent deacetylase
MGLLAGYGHLREMEPARRRMSMASTDILEPIRQTVAAGAAVTVLSGAGISAASGIPTFRGARDSLWARYRPEQLATPEAFAADPELVWRWYDWRRGLIAGSEPNAAHRALAELERRTSVTVVTQNVDGYHQQAGSSQVLEYHGSLWRVRCVECGSGRVDRRVPIPIPPRCPACDGLLRPGVVWFGEGIDQTVHMAAEQAAANCDVFLVVGTAATVYPAAALVATACRAGALVAEFNVGSSAVSTLADLFVAGSAADTLPRLLKL